MNGYQRAKGEKEVNDIFSEISTYQSQLDLLRIKYVSCSFILYLQLLFLPSLYLFFFCYTLCSDKMVAEFSLSKPQIALHFFKTVFFYLFTLPVSLPGSIVHGMGGQRGEKGEKVRG